MTDLELQWTKNAISLIFTLSLSSSFFKTCLLFCHKTRATMQFYLMCLFVQTCFFFICDTMTLSQNCDQTPEALLCPSYLCWYLGRFFAGGSERSGQQIVGPPKKKSSNEVVEDLFKGAREHGAVPLDRSGKGPGESSKARVSWKLRKPMLFLFTLLLYCLLLLLSLIEFLLSLLGLLWWRLQARCSSWGGVSICGWREASLQQPAGCEYRLWMVLDFAFVQTLLCFLV